MPTDKNAAPPMHWTERLAIRITEWVGSARALAIAGLLTILWFVTGPLFHFSDTWQLVMNTISSVITFLMVFLLQRSQNKDTLAMQLKLNELLAAQGGASNRMVNVEELSERVVRALHRDYEELIHRDPSQKASIEEVVKTHREGTLEPKSEDDPANES